MLSPLAIKIGAYALGGIALLGVGISIGHKYTKYKYESAYNQSYSKAIADIKKNYDTQISEYKIASEKRYQEVTNKLAEIGNINEKLKKELNSTPVYHECVLPDSGMQLRTSAINNANNKITSSK